MGYPASIKQCPELWEVVDPLKYNLFGISKSLTTLLAKIMPPDRYNSAVINTDKILVPRLAPGERRGTIATCVKPLIFDPSTGMPPPTLPSTPAMTMPPAAPYVVTATGLAQGLVPGPYAPPAPPYASYPAPPSSFSSAIVASPAPASAPQLPPPLPRGASKKQYAQWRKEYEAACQHLAHHHLQTHPMAALTPESGELAILRNKLRQSHDEEAKKMKAATEQFREEAKRAEQAKKLAHYRALEKKLNDQGLLGEADRLHDAANASTIGLINAITALETKLAQHEFVVRRQTWLAGGLGLFAQVNAWNWRSGGVADGGGAAGGCVGQPDAILQGQRARAEQ